MLAAVLVQWTAVLLASAVAWWGWDLVHALSLVAGGASVVLPNMLFAIGLKLSAHRHVAVVMFGGEFLKVVLSVACLWAAVKWVHPLSWPGLIGGLVVAFLALLVVPPVAAWLDRRRAPGDGQQTM